MQNKLKADTIDQALDGGKWPVTRLLPIFLFWWLPFASIDDRSERVYYHVLHKLSEAIAFLMTLLTFLSVTQSILKFASHHVIDVTFWHISIQVSLLVLSSLSFPSQAETSFSMRNSLLNCICELIIKLCKQNELMVYHSQLGNDRGMGNTMCFWPGVCWGTGAVLCFDTRTLTITSRGFYAVFGHTPVVWGILFHTCRGEGRTPHSLFMLVLNTCFMISMVRSTCMDTGRRLHHSQMRWNIFRLLISSA